MPPFILTPPQLLSPHRLITQPLHSLIYTAISQSSFSPKTPAKKEKYRPHPISTKMKGAVMIMVALAVALVARVGGDAVGDQCANEFPKVTQCLTYATGKADTPTAECCKSVTDLKDRKPVCLCYIIQQIHDGSNPQIKSMGIQEARLLQLPTVCKLANASSAECPKLLGLAPNSPDAAIFTGNGTASAATGAPAAPGTSSSPTTSVKTPSSAYRTHGAQSAIGLVAVTSFLAVFLSCIC